ncbi:MAG: PKD domain-containing protein [Pseudomonadota bacterium]
MGSGEVQISILRRSHHLVAPDAIFFRASVQQEGVAESRDVTRYDPSYHQLRYAWDFGDTGAASDKVVNLPRAHNNLNTAHGKEVAHVFQRAGRYDVRCTVHGPDGLIGEDVLRVSVDDPTRVFAGDRTVLLDPTGAGDPEKYPQARVVRDWDQAFTAAPAGPTGVSRLLIRRGFRYTRTQTQRLTWQNGSLHIGAFGEGPPPVIDLIGGEMVFDVAGNFNDDVVFSGLDLQGPWNAATETGAVGGRRLNGIRSFHGNQRMVLINDCLFSGFDTALWLIDDPDNPDASAFTLNNSTITNWANYGIYTGVNMGSFIAVLGSNISQMPEALQGGGPKDGTRNDHGPVRIAGTGFFHMDACDLFSRNGWTRLAEVPADQPCLRWNTNARPGSRGIVSRTAMEGGFTIVGLRDENGNGPRFLSNLVMEKCLLVGTATTISAIALQFTGQTVRNNIIIMPDVPSAAIDWQAMIQGQNGQNAEGQMNPTAPVEVYSNTLIQKRSPQHQRQVMDETWDLEDFALYSYENNLFATPNMGAMSSGEPGLELTGGALETVAGQWVPRFLGLRYQPQRTSMDSRYQTPRDQVSDLRPQDGTAGADDAMGSSAIDDFFGRLRNPDRPDRGAVETS